MIVTAVESRALVRRFRVAAAYPWGRSGTSLKANSGRISRSRSRMTDATGLREMLPDENVKFTVTAAGYEAASETVRLPEGRSKELVVTLKKAKDAHGCSRRDTAGGCQAPSPKPE